MSHAPQIRTIHERVDELAAQLAAAGLVEVRIEPLLETRRPISQWMRAAQAPGIEVMSAMIHACKPASRPTAHQPLHQGTDHAEDRSL